MSEQELFGLMAVAEENTKAAKLAIGKIAEERAALASTISNLNDQVAALKTSVESAAAKGVRDSLSQAPQAAATALNQATEALNVAGDDVQSAASWIGWKLAGIAALVGVLIVGAAYGLGRYMTPSNQEIAAKRAELAELEANIAAREKHAGRAKLENCGEKRRLCVRVNKKAGVFGEGGDYMILHGY